MRALRPFLFAAAMALLVSACAPGANDRAGTFAAGGEPAGFWLGLWHGVIAPVTFVVGLFSPSVGMYEVRNNGGWYDFGFLLGLGTLHGGGAAGGRARRRSRCKGE